MKTTKKPKVAAPMLAPLVKSRELQLVGTRHDLDDGKVEIVP